MVEYYKSKRIVDRLKWVIVDETGKVVNNSPNKDELKGLEREQKENYKIRNRVYTDEQLLWYLIQFYQKYGRPPTQRDFTNNFEYPNYQVYIKRFKNWSNALKLVELDVESMVRKGIVETDQQKARFSEIIIRDNFVNPSIDLAGKNQCSPCDGICPNGKTYDVKSSGLHCDTQYIFRTNNKHKEEIEIYYLLGFNENYTELMYAWRIPGEIAEKDNFIVGLKSRAKFNVRNMKQYDITEELREVLIKYGYFEKIKNYIKARNKGMTIYEYDKQLYDGCIVVE
jgi:hypothetical protein